MAFNRWLFWGERTLAYRFFKFNHTKLNDLYWSCIPAIKSASVQAKEAKDDITPIDAFNIKGEDARRIPSPMSHWKESFSDFQNWVRLNTVVSMSGYLEVYLKSILAASIASNPGVLLGADKITDGILLIKKGVDVGLKEPIINCTEGEWSKRVSNLTKYFGDMPDSLTNNIKTLEEVRRFRNSVAHTFGRELSFASASINNLRLEHYIGMDDTNQFKRLSQERLKGWLFLIDMLVSDLDKLFRENHIGSFYLLYIFHTYKRKHSAHATNDLKREIANRIKVVPSKEFCREIIGYYNEL